MLPSPTTRFVAVYEYESQNDRAKGLNGKLVGTAYTPEQLGTVLDGAVGYLAFFANGQNKLNNVNDAIDYLKQSHTKTSE